MLMLVIIVNILIILMIVHDGQAEKNGLVMVNFFSYFLTCSNHSTLNDVISKRMITIHNDEHDDDDDKYGEEYDDYQCILNGMISKKIITQKVSSCQNQNRNKDLFIAYCMALYAKDVEKTVI